MSDAIVAMRGTVYESGYGLIAKKVMQDRTISIKAKALYAYLSSFAGSMENRSAFPGVSRMLDDLGVSKDSFYRYRKELELAGYITIVQEKNPNGTFKNNIYYIEAVPCHKIYDTDDPCPKKPDTDMPDTENQDNNNNILLKNNIFNKNEREREDAATAATSTDDELELEYLLLNEIVEYYYPKDRTGGDLNRYVDSGDLWRIWRTKYRHLTIYQLYAAIYTTSNSPGSTGYDATSIIVKRLEHAQELLIPIKRAVMNNIADFRRKITNKFQM